MCVNLQEIPVQTCSINTLHPEDRQNKHVAQNKTQPVCGPPPECQTRQGNRHTDLPSSDHTMKGLM